MKGVYTPKLVNDVTIPHDKTCSICCYPIKYLAKVQCSNQHELCATCIIRLKIKYNKDLNKLLEKKNKKKKKKK